MSTSALSFRPGDRVRYLLRHRPREWRTGTVRLVWRALDVDAVEIEDDEPGWPRANAMPELGDSIVLLTGAAATPDPHAVATSGDDPPADR